MIGENPPYVPYKFLNGDSILNDGRNFVPI